MRRLAYGLVLVLIGAFWAAGCASVATSTVLERADGKWLFDAPATTAINPALMEELGAEAAAEVYMVINAQTHMLTFSHGDDDSFDTEFDILSDDGQVLHLRMDARSLADITINGDQLLLANPQDSGYNMMFRRAR